MVCGTRADVAAGSRVASEAPASHELSRRRHVLSDRRRHLRPEQLDRAQQLVVRHRPDAELREEAIVAEDLVLLEDLLGHLLRAAHEQVPTRLPPSLELLPRQWRPAALAP